MMKHLKLTNIIQIIELYNKYNDNKKKYMEMGRRNINHICLESDNRV